MVLGLLAWAVPYLAKGYQLAFRRKLDCFCITSIVKYYNQIIASYLAHKLRSTVYPLLANH